MLIPINIEFLKQTHVPLPDVLESSPRSVSLIPDTIISARENEGDIDQDPVSEIKTDIMDSPIKIELLIADPKVMILDENISPRNAKEIERNFNLCAGGRFRFNVLFAIIPIAIAVLPFLVPLYVTFAINAFYAIQFIIFLIFATITHCKIFSKFNLIPKIQQETLKIRGLTNILMTCVYKEPHDFIITSLKKLRKLDKPGPIILLVCIEEKTPNNVKLIQLIYEEFRNDFEKVCISVHPANLEGEIPGKCSNINYGLRSMTKFLEKQEFFDRDSYIVTNFDIDTMFHPQYFKLLTENMQKEKNRNEIVWQPILYYNWDLDKSSFITRITGLLRNTMMMGALIPLNINVMSVYSATLRVYFLGDYTHPAYQMEDIICYIRWMINTAGPMKIKAIYLPVLSGPTSGETYWKDLSEWARQLRRWSIGSAEVFHYFCIKFRKIRFRTALWWGLVYLNYYVGFLCIQGFFMITTLIVSLTNFTLMQDDQFNTLLFLLLLGLFYFGILWMMILNYFAVKKLKIMGIKENICFLRHIWIFASSILVIISFSFVAYYGFLESVIRGKKVCKHGASRKDQLEIIKSMMKSLKCSVNNKLKG